MNKIKVFSCNSLHNFIQSLLENLNSFRKLNDKDFTYQEV